MNRMRNIGMAKQKVLDLSVGYVPPSLRQDIEVLGRSGLSTLYSANIHDKRNIERIIYLKNFIVNMVLS